MLAPLPTRSVFGLRTFGRAVNPLSEAYSCQISEMLRHAAGAAVLSGPLLFKFQQVTGSGCLALTETGNAPLGAAQQIGWCRVKRRC
jgi:hypothetical protein